MTGIRWDAGAFNAHLRQMADGVDRATQEGVRDGTAAIQRRAQVNSSGRPGPNAVTGAHRRGIVAEGPRRIGASRWEGRVRPTEVYSPILERRYPWLGPAVRWAVPGVIAAAFQRAWSKAVRS